ncbi:hypothetical protein QBC35DRAFT_502687 [Podospora australis]|uniref:Uncharacterized protein n=1 Tax=Podospora australis TaxID=1536484 RepID=A0AAN6WR10_9PEZI|nr:hypothetical protein QBC35DRAFT_502687 [Podospora australis]
MLKKQTIRNDTASKRSMSQDRSTDKRCPSSSYDPPTWGDLNNRSDNEQISRLPAHLRSNYTSHLRSTSHTSWDGQDDLHHLTQPLPSPGSSRPNHRLNRPHSVGSLPHPSSLFPTDAANRWSYDGERMPHSPSLPPLPRPPTPGSRPSSRTASPARSQPPSRPRSVRFDENVHFSSEVSTPYQNAAGASTPTLRVTHPDGSVDPYLVCSSQSPVEQRMTEEKQPSASTPMISQAPILENNMTEKRNSSHAKERRMSVDSVMNTPGCCGLCERGTVKAVGSKIAAWLIGTLIPVTFGLATKLLAGLCH